MPRPPGRPADEQHRCIARMLHALVIHPTRGCTKDELMTAAGLDPANPSDERKYRRYLKALRAAGWRIETLERDGNDFALRLVVVDPRIHQTFTDAQRHELLRAATRAGLGQLYADLDPQRPDGPPGPAGPDGLGLAEHAVRHRCLLTFTYKGRPRRVHPDDVFFSGNDWFLRGLDEADSAVEFKLFRLIHAHDLDAGRPGTAGPARALPPPSRDPMQFRGGEPVAVELSTTADDLPDVLATLGVNGHRILDPAGPDGQVRLEVLVTHVDAFLGRLFELDSRVRLVGPESIRDHTRSALVSATRRS